MALLLGYATSTGEATTGLLRDGSVHHESAAEAAVHQETNRGDHGHEDPGAGAEHGDDHQHGTSGDHCTHAHGMALPSVCDFGIAVSFDFADAPVPLIPSGSTESFHFRPPKA